MSRHPSETVLASGLTKLLVFGVPLSIGALLYPSPKDEGLLAYTLVHLTIVQVLTLQFTVSNSRHIDGEWFVESRRPFLARAAALTAASVGFAALLTLATAAAARYDVSLQFLQLLSSLDIAWVVAALYLGATRLWGKIAGTGLASLLVAACVWSIGAYLQVVGFGPGGEWLVDGSQMMRIVIPADLAAAILSLSVLFAAARVADQPTEQASPQS